MLFTSVGQASRPVAEGLRPAKAHENHGRSWESEKARDGEVEKTVEKLRPLACLIRSVCS